MQQEVFFEIAMQRINELLIIACAKRGHNQGLSFTTGEQRRAMRAGQKTRFADNRTNRIQGAAINPLAVFHNRTTQNRRFQLLQCRTKVFICQFFFGKLRFDRFFCGGYSGNAVLFIKDRIGVTHLRFTQGFHLFIQRAVIRWGEIKRLIRRNFCQINDQIKHGLHLLMGKCDSAEHFILGQLIGLGFNHHHGVFGARHNQIQTLVGVVAQTLHIVNSRVQDVFPILKAHTAACNRPHERHARNRQRCRRGDHRNDVGIIHQIMAENRTHHENFVLEARNKQRANGSVDQARGQRLFFGRTRFALEKATRHLACGVVFLLVMHSQRKEILTWLSFFGEGHICHNAGFPKRCDHCAICLTGNLARF